MKNFGYLRIASAIPMVHLADVAANVKEIIKMAEKAKSKGAQVLLFPELSLTGYSCGDLFFQETLLSAVRDGLNALCEWSLNKNILFVVGAPIPVNTRLYNCGVAIYEGSILAAVPKTYVPNNNEFYEKRWFNSADRLTENLICWHNLSIPIGTDILIRHRRMENVVVGIEVCEDLWAPIPPASYHALAGATLILNPSASNDLIGKHDYRMELVKQQSARLNACYAYCSCGLGESTSDLVFGGDALIFEKGKAMATTRMLKGGAPMILADIDFDLLQQDRKVQTSFRDSQTDKIYRSVYFDTADNTDILRTMEKYPFIPEQFTEFDNRCQEILEIQTMGLVGRIRHLGNVPLVIGVSGGLDSTLALLVCVKAYDLLGLSRKNIMAITMPGFGTTGRTYENAKALMNALGVSFKEISIKEACLLHFKDIGHDPENNNVTYENAQARERTQILMDIANTLGGMVVGTGDLSELALGWATYNGDHMSMYGVNAGIPKTLVHHLVKYLEGAMDEKVAKILEDVLATPVSPELLPPDKSGKIAQKTEDIVGPYELHDFFLYHMLRNGFSPKKIVFLAERAFEDTYSRETIVGWLKIFYKRFFSQQFKRSCMPDGPKIGSVALSPRGDLRMPSDAKATGWLNEVSEI